MKKFFKEFGAFIKRGNVLDLAVAMIIGTAFNSIVKSLVNDIVMPTIGVVCKVNITEMKAVLVAAVVNESGEVIRNAVTLNYGAFLQSVIDFLIIALSVFVAIKVISSFNKRMEQVKTTLKKYEEAFTEKIKNDEPKVEVQEEEIGEAKIEVQEEKIAESKPTIEELLTDIKELLKQHKTDCK